MPHVEREIHIHTSAEDDILRIVQPKQADQTCWITVQINGHPERLTVFMNSDQMRQIGRRMVATAQAWDSAHDAEPSAELETV